jgi:hypothetical protein
MQILFVHKTAILPTGFGYNKMFRKPTAFDKSNRHYTGQGETHMSKLS